MGAHESVQRGLYYNGRAKSMGKRELLLISGFAVIGLLVYQLTCRHGRHRRRVRAWWARLRSHVGQNRVEKHYERKDEVKVPAASARFPCSWTAPR